jgi:tRNA modification GTPase
MAETIVAGITPPGRSAVAVVRISGGESWSIARKILNRFPETIGAGRFFYSKVLDHGSVVDDVVISLWKGPSSYTGEDVVEIGSHGNPLIVQKIVELVLAAGARFALPGEFSQRAFTNGKMDLTQVESVIDIISASTEVALRAAHAMREGRLGAKIQDFKKELIETLAHLEAYIDFPDEDISPETGLQFQNRVSRLKGEVDLLLKTAPYGKAIREGIRTVIVGEPNVGKSTFLNLLLREKRAIVSDRPGTTRDTIEASYQLKGIPLILVDTAGQRETEDLIEREGIDRARRWMDQADLVIYLVDATQEDAVRLDQFKKSGQLWIKIANKSDVGENRHPDAFALSCRDEHAAEKIETWLSDQLISSMPSMTISDFAINARQEGALRLASGHLQKGLESLQMGESPEYTSIGLRAALDSFGSVVGMATHEDILDSLFKQFCIGK